MNRILQLRKGGDVKRFHTVTMLRENLVSAHSWGVAVLICDILPNPSVNLLKAALYHDVAEHVTGDISAPTKWQFPKLAEALLEVESEVEKRLGLNADLTEEERLILKFADMSDLILFCTQEFRLGNREAVEIINRGLAYLEDRIWPSVCVNYFCDLKSFIKEQLK